MVFRSPVSKTSHPSPHFDVTWLKFSVSTKEFSMFAREIYEFASVEIQITCKLIRSYK